MRAFNVLFIIIVAFATACATTEYPDAPTACPTVDSDGSGATDDTEDGVTDPTIVIEEPGLSQDYEQPGEYVNGAENWVRLVCPESCTISYQSEDGSFWTLFTPESKDNMKDGAYTFAGDIVFPALEGRLLKISVGGEFGVGNGTYVEVSEGNTLRYQAMVKGGFVYKTTPRADITGTGPDGAYEFTVLKDWTTPE